MVRRYAPKGGGSRLWITSALGDPKAWRLSRHDWTRLEKAFGCTFDKALRKYILRAVRRYLDWSTAPGASDYLLKIERARKLSRELRAVYVSLGDARSLLAPHWESYFPRDSDDDDAAPAGDADLLAWALSRPHRKGRDHRDIGAVISTLCGAFDDAMLEAGRRESGLPSFKDNWQQLVIDLARAFAHVGIEVTAHKNQYRKPSPFVKFVREINSLIPVEHPFSDDALAQAVWRTIKEKPKKVGQNRPRRRGKVVPPMTRK